MTHDDSNEIGMRRAKKLLILGLTALFFGACGEPKTVDNPLPGTPGAIAAGEPAARDEFAFAVMGDSRGRQGGVNPYSLLKVLDHLAAQGRTKLVIFSGDMVNGSSTPEGLSPQLVEWKRLIKPYQKKGIEFLVTPGNHEIDNGTMFELEPGRLGKPTAAGIAHQKAVLAAFPGITRNGPPEGGMTYSVRRGKVLIVVLDSYRPGAFQTVDTPWLERTLLAAMSSDNKPSFIFVATHSPAFPVGGHTADSLPNYNLDREALVEAGGDVWPWQPGSGGPRDVDVDWRDKRDALWQVLVAHGVTAFLVGHEHALSWQRVDGVWQLISGAMTQRLYPQNTTPLELYGGKAQNPKAGDTFWHGGEKTWGYVLVSIKDNRARAQIWGWTDKDDTVHLVREVVLD